MCTNRRFDRRVVRSRHAPPTLCVDPNGSYCSAFRGDTMAAIEKAINDFFNSGSLKAAAYRANAIFGFSSKVRRSYVK